MNKPDSLLRKIRYGVPNQIKRHTRSPFPASNQFRFGGSSFRGPIVHCTHHKMGTKWFTSVLHAIADHYGLSFQWIDNDIDELNLKADIIVLNHSDVVSQQISPCRGSHLVRDFRDVVISGYHYHLWTDEEWALRPSARYHGMSFQQYLKSLPEEKGILAEIDRLADYVDERQMRDWDYAHAQFLELKYEHVFGSEEQAFRRLFQHYGFTEEATDTSLEIAARFSFDKQAIQSGSRKRTHLRSGRSGQWQEIFTKEHKDYFKERLGVLLVRAGYETNNNW